MRKLKQIIIASGNPAKVERYSRMLFPYAQKIVGLKSLGVNEKPKETGETAEQNVIIKARFFIEKTGKPVFCEDESLFVDFLPENSQPGVHVRRINRKDEVNDEELLLHWENIIAKIPAEKRTGHWHHAYCFGLPSNQIQTVTIDHPIKFFSPSSKIRIPGWPMSSLQGPAAFGKPDSELSSEERKIHEQKSDVKILEVIKKFFV